MKGYKSVHFVNHARPLELFVDVTPVCVEVYENSEPLTTFVHPENAVYLFGPRGRESTTSCAALVSPIRAHSGALLPELECGGKCCVSASLDVASIVEQGTTVAAS